MDTLKSAYKYTLLLCLGFALWSCEGRREIEETEEITVDTAESGDTARVIKTGNTAEDQLEEFRAWLNQQTAKGDTAIRREWPAVREELRTRNAQLEEKFDSLSTQSKEEFREMQSRYKRWEDRQERRQNQPLDANKVAEYRGQLLREYKDLEKIKPENIREAYLVFMGEVRAKRSNWTQDDWDHVDYVYSQLNQRRREIEGNLRTSDKLKIRTLQAEYLALEGSADTQSMLRGDADR
jgi:small-conductance mechanosensitive channel